MIYLLFFIVLLTHASTSLDYQVSNGEELELALAIVEPGDSITMIRNEPTTLILEGIFYIATNGTPEARITFKGHPNIVFSNTLGFACLEIRASYWDFSDLTLRGCQDGIFLYRTSHNTFSDTIIGNTTNVALQIYGGTHIFTNTYIYECNNGINAISIVETIFHEGEIVDFEEKGIEWGGTSTDNILENFRIKDMKNYSDEMLALKFYSNLGYGNVIRGNRFITNYMAFISRKINIFGDYGGVFENNLIQINFEPIPNGYSFLQLGDIEDYIVRNNEVVAVYNKAINIFQLGHTANRIQFLGNHINFPEGGEPEPICIFGDPEIHSGNTVISDDNFCVNGKLTNIFE